MATQQEAGQSIHLGAHALNALLMHRRRSTSSALSTGADVRDKVSLSQGEKEEKRNEIWSRKSCRFIIAQIESSSRFSDSGKSILRYSFIGQLPLKKKSNNKARGSGAGVGLTRFIRFFTDFTAVEIGVVPTMGMGRVGQWPAECIIPSFMSFGPFIISLEDIFHSSLSNLYS